MSLGRLQKDAQRENDDVSLGRLQKAKGHIYQETRLGDTLNFNILFSTSLQPKVSYRNLAQLRFSEIFEIYDIYLLLPLASASHAHAWAHSVQHGSAPRLPSRLHHAAHEQLDPSLKTILASRGAEGSATVNAGSSAREAASCWSGRPVAPAAPAASRGMGSGDEKPFTP